MPRHKILYLYRFGLQPLQSMRFAGGDPELDCQPKVAWKAKEARDAAQREVSEAKTYAHELEARLTELQSRNTQGPSKGSTRR